MEPKDPSIPFLVQLADAAVDVLFDLVEKYLPVNGRRAAGPLTS